MVFEHEGEHASQWDATSSIASKVGCTTEKLRHWVRQAERATGKRPGLTTEERPRLKALERENRKPRRANEILRKASAFFAQADPSRWPARARRDAEPRGAIPRVWRENFSVYGPRKGWKQLQREGIEVARCTIDRLMRYFGLRGALRRRKFKTTLPDEATVCPADLNEALRKASARR